MGPTQKSNLISAILAQNTILSRGNWRQRHRLHPQSSKGRAASTCSSSAEGCTLVSLSHNNRCLTCLSWANTASILHAPFTPAARPRHSPYCTDLCGSTLSEVFCHFVTNTRNSLHTRSWENGHIDIFPHGIRTWLLTTLRTLRRDVINVSVFPLSVLSGTASKLIVVF